MSIKEALDVAEGEAMQAFLDGTPREGCPHPEQSLERGAWLAGWDSAERMSIPILAMHGRMPGFATGERLPIQERMTQLMRDLREAREKRSRLGGGR